MKKKMIYGGIGVIIAMFLFQHESDTSHAKEHIYHPPHIESSSISIKK